MAERLLRHALSAESEPLNKLNIISAGIAAGNGYPASPNSVAVFKKVGIDLNDHSTTQASEDILDQANLIFGMTSSHLDSVRYFLGDSADDRLYLMREFIEDAIDREIPDPFGRGFTDYENARDSMVEAVPSLIDFLKTKFANKS